MVEIPITDTRKLKYDSPAMQEVVDEVDLFAPTEQSVLITGATGTGKESVARLIHERSPRKGKPFIPINCAAIPRELIESELFGHEQGSFTGAHKQKKGVFEEAEGGTLFLDEIGEMPPDMQVKLLRVLQDGEFRRVGGDRTLKANVRIVAATSREGDISRGGTTRGFILPTARR